MTAPDPLQPVGICRNRATTLRRLVLLLPLIWGAKSIASDPAPSWGAGWQAHVSNTYCELRREYYIPFRSDPDRRGFLSGTAFDRAFVRFSANTQLHGDLTPPESLGVIQFHLYVYPEYSPVEASQRIVRANLGGYPSEANVVSNAEIHTFSLGEDESAQLLQRFINSEMIEFELSFANGDQRQFKIYPSGDRTFYVWADMFRTCIRSHTGKKR